jgi:hypothetical protein
MSGAWAVPEIAGQWLKKHFQFYFVFKWKIISVYLFVNHSSWVYAGKYVPAFEEAHRHELRLREKMIR